MSTWWTADEDAILHDGMTHGLTLRQIGAQLGKSKQAVHQRWWRIQRGVRRCWNNADDNRLVVLLEAHRSWAEIAAALGYSRFACQARAHVLGVGFRSANGYSVNDLTRLMGVDHHAARRWVRLGLLSVHRTSQRAGRGYYQFVDHDDLVEFLADEDHWHYWEPERITDLALREWSTELRRGLSFLTTSQAAPLLYMTPIGVQVAIREGRLRAVRRGVVGDRWLIRSDWVQEPTRRSLVGVPRPAPFTPDELAVVRRWWGKRPATWISQRVGRGTDTAIHAVARRLGLPRLGRGCWKAQRARQEALV